MRKTPAKIKVEVCLDRVGLRGRSVNESVKKISRGLFRPPSKKNLRLGFFVDWVRET